MNKKVIVLVVVLLLVMQSLLPLSSKVAGAGYQWVPVNNGLYGGIIYSLAIDPAATQVIYAGTFGSGVFKSIDGGSNWTPIGLTDSDVDSLAIDPADTQVIYAGTYGNGVFKSTDGGSNWTQINTGLTNTNVWSLAIDPTATQVIYAGTDGGAFKMIQSNSPALDHFEFNTISNQTQNVPFNITITAKDQYGSTYTDFNSSITLSVNKGTITPTTTTDFVNGVLSNFSVTIPEVNTGVTITATYSDKTGTSNSFDVNTPPPLSLSLSSPNGSESLTPSTTQNISFSISGDTTGLHYFVAYYTVDSGNSYEFVKNSSGNIIYLLYSPGQSNYTIPWYVPVRYSTMAKVVVYAMDINNKMLAFDVSDNFFKIADTGHLGGFSVSITKPLVNETVTPGTTYRIEWTTSGTTPSDLSYFVVFISYEDGRNDSWHNVCEEQHYYPLSSATYFDWNVSSSIRSDMVKIVVYPMSLPNNFLVGNSTPLSFKVLPPSYNFSVSITHPLSGENLTALSSYNLQWTTSNEPTELAGFFFYISVDNGTSWELLRLSDSPSTDPLFVPKSSSPYSYNWNVWKRLSNNCKLMIVAVDSNNIYTTYNILGIQISDIFNIIP
jgi:hypothetical protein